MQKITIKNTLKSERKKKVSSLKRKYHEAPEKNARSQRYIIEIQSQEDSIEKINIKKILNQKVNMKKKKKKEENPEQKNENS